MIRIMILIFPISFPMYFSCISHGFPHFHLHQGALQAYVQALWSLATSRGLAVNSKGNKMRSAAATWRQRSAENLGCEWGTLEGYPMVSPVIIHPCIDGKQIHL